MLSPDFYSELLFCVASAGIANADRAIGLRRFFAIRLVTIHWMRALRILIFFAPLYNRRLRLCCDCVAASDDRQIVIDRPIDAILFRLLL
jgi:hypothetical protein